MQWQPAQVEVKRSTPRTYNAYNVYNSLSPGYGLATSFELRLGGCSYGLLTGERNCRAHLPLPFSSSPAQWLRLSLGMQPLLRGHRCAHAEPFSRSRQRQRARAPAPTFAHCRTLFALGVGMYAFSACMRAGPLSPSSSSFLFRLRAFGSCCALGCAACRPLARRLI